MRLSRKPVALSVNLVLDPVTEGAIAPFDLAPDAPVEFYPWERPALPSLWRIGLIVGGSGSGKSTLLREFGEYREPRWRNERSIAAHFPDAETVQRLFGAVGLNSVPTWRKPYSVLSTGERFRADLARLIGDGAVVDEYTSVVSRSVAASASRALRGYVREAEVTGMVIATCHRDVIPWLQPSWIIDTDLGELTVGGTERTELWSATRMTEVGTLRMELR